MSQPVNGDLPGARRQLELAISALIEPKPATVQRDDGSTTITWLDSLLDQLLDAVHGQTGERSGGQSTIPVWADCLDLLQDVAKKTAQWHPEWPMPDIAVDDPPPPALARLEALQARKWRVEDVDHINEITAEVNQWVIQISAKLYPEPVIYLMAPDKPGAAACPACSTDYVYRRDPSENNKPKKQPALKVMKDGDGEPYCQCQNCRYNWGPGRLRMLAGALGYPLPAGVLE